LSLHLVRGCSCPYYACRFSSIFERLEMWRSGYGNSEHFNMDWMYDILDAEEDEEDDWTDGSTSDSEGDSDDSDDGGGFWGFGVPLV
jgi:hypothetical protein